MKFPWSKASDSTPKGDQLTLDERVRSIESRMDQLAIDWEDVLSKLARRAGREAARAKVDLLKSLEREPTSVDSRANGTAEPAGDEYSGPPGVGMLRGPSKDELRRRMSGGLRRA